MSSPAGAGEKTKPPTLVTGVIEDRNPSTADDADGCEWGGDWKPRNTRNPWKKRKKRSDSTADGPMLGANHASFLARLVPVVSRGRWTMRGVGTGRSLLHGP